MAVVLGTKVACHTQLGGKIRLQPLVFGCPRLLVAPVSAAHLIQRLWRLDESFSRYLKQQIMMSHLIASSEALSGLGVYKGTDVQGKCDCSTCKSPTAGHESQEATVAGWTGQDSAACASVKTATR